MPPGRTVHLLPSWSYSLVTVEASLLIQDHVWSCSLLPFYRAQHQATGTIESYPGVPGRRIQGDACEVRLCRLAWLALECCLKLWTSAHGTCESLNFGCHRVARSMADGGNAVPVQFMVVFHDAISVTAGVPDISGFSQEVQHDLQQVNTLIRRLGVLSDWRGAAQLRAEATRTDW